MSAKVIVECPEEYADCNKYVIVDVEKISSSTSDHSAIDIYVTWACPHGGFKKTSKAK